MKKAPVKANQSKGSGPSGSTQGASAKSYLGSKSHNSPKKSHKNQPTK